MLKFVLGEKDYTVSDYISLDKYAKIYKVKDLFTDTYFAAKLVNIVTDAPLEELLKGDYEEINFIAAHILSLIPLDKDVPFMDRFELDGVHYGFFPSWRELTFAEFVDMDTISSKPVNELLDMMHILAAIMYRPIINQASEHNFIIEDYDLKSMVKRSELFKKKMDVKIMLGAQLFFYQFGKRYSLYGQAFLTQNLKWTKKLKLIWKLRKWILAAIFKKRTDGLQSSTDLLQTILTNTNTSIKKV